MNNQNINIDTIKNTVDCIVEYLFISIKHRHSLSINRVLFTIVEIYRMLSSGLTTKLYLKDKDLFESRVKGMKIIISGYGRLGRLLIDNKIEDGFLTYLEFITDTIGNINFEYPESESAWDELQEINNKLIDDKLNTLFLVCAKAINKEIYSFVFLILKEMTSEDPNFIDINKKQLFRLLEDERLERFWKNGVSFQGAGEMNVFGLLERPINAISKCYLILRSYSLYKGIDLSKLMTFPIPKDKEKKRTLYYLIDSFKLHKHFLDDAYKDLLSEKSSWEELFKGNFIKSLDDTWSIINKCTENFDQKQKEIKISMPLDDEKIKTFRQILLDSFFKVRQKNTWIDYSFQEFSYELEDRKLYERVARRSLMSRDIFAYGLNVIGNILAQDLGNALSNSEINGIINRVREVTLKKSFESELTQDCLTNAMEETPLGSQSIAIIASNQNRIRISNWPIFRGKYLNSDTDFSLFSKGKEYISKFFFYNSTIENNEIILIPLKSLKVETEDIPLVEINEMFKFSDYKADASDQVEFIMELIIKSIELKKDYKALSITFKKD